jgi:hypothetical protein
MKQKTKKKASSSKKGLKLKTRVRGGAATAKLGLNHNLTKKPLEHLTKKPLGLKTLVRGSDAPARIALNHNLTVR